MEEIEIQRDERVMSAGGAEMGRVKHVIVDANRVVTELVLEHEGNEFVVPMTELDRVGGTLTMRGAGSALASGATFARDQYHAVDEDDLADAPMRATGQPVLEDARRDSAVIAEPGAAAMDTRTTREVRETRDVAMPATNRETVRGNENITVPVVEEKLTAGVREVQGGVFRLSKSVRQEQVSIDVPLQHEEARITRTEVNRPATAEDLAQMDRDIEIPLRNQEAVVSKEAVVTGEVELRKETITDTKRVTDTVRREEVHVDESATSTHGAHMEGLNEVQRTRFARMNADEQMRYRDMTPADRTRFETDYDRRNPIEKIVDKIEGKDDPRR